MVVRPAEREDRPQLLRLIEGYFTFYRTNFDPAKVEALLDLLEEDPGLGVQLVADADGRLQGFASLYACVDTPAAARNRGRGRPRRSRPAFDQRLQPLAVVVRIALGLERPG